MEILHLKELGAIESVVTNEVWVYNFKELGDSKNWVIFFGRIYLVIDTFLYVASHPLTSVSNFKALFMDIYCIKTIWGKFSKYSRWPPFWRF